MTATATLVSTNQSSAAIDGLSALMKAVADPLRLDILRLLGLSSFGVLELAELMNMSQPGMSHHLKVLAKAGWVESRREGNAIFYRRHLPVAGELGDWLRQQLFDELDGIALSAELESKLDIIQEQRAEQSREFFSRNAELFAKRQDLIAEHDLYDDAAWAILQRSLPNGGKQALEVGPGEGHFLRRLASAFKQVFGLDNSVALIESAKQQLAEHNISNVVLQQANWPKVELPSAYDLVALNMVLHHLPTPSRSMAKAADVLAPNGVLLITELCSHEQQWAKEQCGDLWLGFDEGELISWAERAGLVHQESQFLAQKNGFQIQILSFKKAKSKKG